MDRKRFLTSSLLGLSSLVVSPILASQRHMLSDEIPIEVIKEFVTAGHNDLDRVQGMLAKRPFLLHSRYDWGNGDYEEAIEGAAHLGRKDIANYLIEQGARVNLFTLTMLGKKDLVIPILEEYPSLIQAQGPHGFSMLHHAKMGGADAQGIFDYLKEKGLETLKF